MSLWHVGCFKLKQSRSKKTSTFLLTSLRIWMEDLFKEGAINIGNYRMDQVCTEGGNSYIYLLKFLSAFHCLCLAQQTFIYQTFAFPSPCQLPSSPLKSQTTTPKILFVVVVEFLGQPGEPINRRVEENFFLPGPFCMDCFKFCMTSSYSPFMSQLK